MNAQMLSWRGLLRDYSRTPFGSGTVFRTARGKKTFRIDQATLREMGGLNGNQFILGKSHLKSQILWGKQDIKITKIFFVC